ncbi:inner (transmembrane) protein [Legionella lansingensis]|uniref:Transmembrane protein n=1 Tax=Legionella lansingensis TaxID=45067 RepID=A0A0W0VEX1_9GAMM|nr:disulfide bond formation protein B [Legionella lansingensis]KTD18619.1 transmembrane protein [Legionella lansingensis]SNV46169.1 inner (transmembrane) protein [Legionella lansingensis]
MITQNKLHRLGNMLGLLLSCFILVFAFYQQLIDHDLPCPLCLLQRICFIGVGLCLCMSLMNGIRISYYGLMILSSLLGLGIALRQIFLHVSPGDLGYGSPLLGLYLYTWSAIGFAIIIGLVAIGLLFERGFYEPSQPPGRWLYALMSFFLLLILANGISTFLECGPFICKDRPAHYYLFDTMG